MDIGTKVMAKFNLGDILKTTDTIQTPYDTIPVGTILKVRDISIETNKESGQVVFSYTLEPRLWNLKEEELLGKVEKLN
jgi:hypothetical protein